DEDRVYGDDGRDRLFGDGQDDHVYGGPGADRLDGGAGSDTLVSIDDAASDTLAGGTGKDSFWADDQGLFEDGLLAPTADELETNVHYVSGFDNGADKTLDGDSIADPTGGKGSADFSDRPLFSKFGPQVFDVDQGDLGDCWLLGSLAAAARVEPNAIRQLVVDLGDGTYAVHLEKSVLNTDVYYRVDGDLPVDPAAPATPQFAGLGVGRSLWVPIVEKAYALDRGGRYADLNGDTVGEVLGEIGGTGRVYHMSVEDAFEDFDPPTALTGVFQTQSDVADVDRTLPNHAYAIYSVQKDGNGNAVSVQLYNPHGVDNVPLYNLDGTPMLDAKGDQMYGCTDGKDDGLITLTLQEARDDSFNPIGAVTAHFDRFS
ncbi:MAG TPA: C2 family cysteine protease, partial [Gemmataceae bacterium]|nr:C2 family cysteine protease [Gemmataceae bacterium]